MHLHKSWIDYTYNRTANLLNPVLFMFYMPSQHFCRGVFVQAVEQLTCCGVKLMDTFTVICKEIACHCSIQSVSVSLAQIFIH